MKKLLQLLFKESFFNVLRQGDSLSWHTKHRKVQLEIRVSCFFQGEVSDRVSQKDFE